MQQDDHCGSDRLPLNGSMNLHLRREGNSFSCLVCCSILLGKVLQESMILFSYMYLVGGFEPGSLD
jgi:hypothetical protein